MVTRGRALRRDSAIAAGFVVACTVVVLPDLVRGPGFYVDDWRNLARIDTVGWLRSAEASKFASRPGAWCVETVLYPLLRDHATAWVVALVALNAATAMALFVLLRRFTTGTVAASVVLVWIALPDRTSLKVFANTAPMTFGLFLLCLGVIAMDAGRPVLGAVAVGLGGLCYEVMLLPGLAALVVLHLVAARGSRPAVAKAAAVVLATGGLMLIHPTYSVGGAARGSPRDVLPGHFGAGLSTIPAVSTALAVVAAVGIVVGLVAFGRGARTPGSGPWLVVVGLGVMATGLAIFVVKWPTGHEGQADRNFVVSSVGAAAVWVGIARVLLGRWRVGLAAAATAFAVVCGASAITFQANWVRSAADTRTMLRAVDCRFHGHPPPDLWVGPAVPVPGNVRAIQQFFLADASRVVVGHPMAFHLAEGEPAWARVPRDRRITWAELLASPRCPTAGGPGRGGRAVDRSFHDSGPGPWGTQRR